MFQQMRNNNAVVYININYINILLKTAKFLAISNVSYDKSKNLFTYFGNNLCCVPIIMYTITCILQAFYGHFGMDNEFGTPIQIKESIVLTGCTLSLIARIITYNVTNIKLTKILNSLPFKNFQVDKVVIMILLAQLIILLFICQLLLSDILNQNYIGITISVNFVNKIVNILAILLETVIISAILNEIQKQNENTYKYLKPNGRNSILHIIKILTNEQHRINQLTKLAKEVFNIPVLCNTLLIFVLVTSETYIAIASLRRTKYFPGFLFPIMVCLVCTIMLILKIQIKSWNVTSIKVS